MFSENGSNLVLTGRRMERLQKLKEELEQKTRDIKIKIFQLDVRSNESILSLVKEMELDKEFSNVDILVNNAGLALGVKQTHENDLNQMHQMIDTNVKGVFFMLKAFLPSMIARNAGHIINISSVAGFEGYPGGSVYCATKFAVQGLTEVLRKELVSYKIRVTSICPALCETEFSLVRFTGDKDAAKKPYQGIEPLHAEDIADSILYVASRPPHVQVSEMTLYPTNQASPTMIYRTNQ